MADKVTLQGKRLVYSFGLHRINTSGFFVPVGLARSWLDSVRQSQPTLDVLVRAVLLHLHDSPFDRGVEIVGVLKRASEYLATVRARPAHRGSSPEVYQFLATGVGIFR